VSQIVESIAARIRAVLPLRWFPDESPVLDTILTGLASGWIQLFNLLDYIRAQTRVATATDAWLDLIAADFFWEAVQKASASV